MQGLELRSRNALLGELTRYKRRMVSLLGKLKWQPEGGDQLWAKKSRQRGNLLGKRRTNEREHLNSKRSIGACCFVGSIHHECWVSIGMRRREPPLLMDTRRK
jgi:hypothetical protein